MSAQNYLGIMQWILSEIQAREMPAIKAAAKLMAASIRKKGRVYMFGSGHSVIPVLDIFPRYGGFVGFFPLYDPRLMWSNVIGPGGARELLWIERQEGYIKVFLQSYPLEKRDVMLVFSHGGLNAAPIDMALEARARGLKVVTVSSHANVGIAKRTHSSGKVLSEIADVAIDNHVPPEDALVDVGQIERVAAGSTVAAVSIAMSLVAETAAVLARTGKVPPTFVSPNVHGVPPGHMDRVYRAFTEFYYARPFKGEKPAAARRGKGK
ncbi:MAG: sugar isomerase domain-containing protein [Acidobacteriota bacterium]